MFDFLELEETVGKAWHRLVGRAATWPRHPDHAVTLDAVKAPLGVVFRGLGGEAGVQLAAATPRASGHRLSLRQKLGLAEERLDQSGRDTATLFLPPRIDLFPDRALNRDLYLWLAAWFAHVPVVTLDEADPLRRDLAVLARVRSTTSAVLSACPGLAAPYAALRRATRAARPERPLTPAEATVERVVLALLAEPGPSPDAFERLLAEAARPGRAPAGYQPMLPVPLWGEARAPQAAAVRTAAEDDRAASSDLAAADTRRRFATRRDDAARDRADPFILNRFEKILALAEMIEVDRPTDDREDENARKAADDLDEIPLSNRKGKPASRLKFDLDLPPEAVDPTRLDAETTYPEWDYGRKAYLPAHCRVLTATAPDGGESWEPDEAARRRIARVRRQFEALRPRHEILRGEAQGEELDLDAVVRARTDLAAGGAGSDRIWQASRPARHDLSVTILVDVSLSTDAWSEERRILDVEKEALLVLAHGLAAAGEDHSILTFTSRRRDWVRVETVKGFDEAFDDRVVRRIAALKPGWYTRIGAAVRHASAQLAERPSRQKLLLVLTDGKPNDIDHYEGRFGIEDTRKAVGEARRAGQAVFGVTVDAEARSYFPTLFGRGGYAIVGHVGKLPAALPAIYRQIVR